MKLGVLFCTVLMASAGCGGQVSMEITEASLSIQVSGSPAFPYVEAKSGETADAVLRFTAVRVRSHKKTQSEVRLKRLSLAEWQKRPNIAVADATEGVLISVSFTAEKDGRAVIDDRREVVVPFEKDQKRTDGLITYEAVWSKNG